VPQGIIANTATQKPPAHLAPSATRLHKRALKHAASALPDMSAIRPDCRTTETILVPQGIIVFKGLCCQQRAHLAPIAIYYEAGLRRIVQYARMNISALAVPFRSLVAKQAGTALLGRTT